MSSLIRSLIANRKLLRDFVVRDLKSRYVGSAMGFFWSVVVPIVNLFVFMFVFRLVLKARWGDGGSAGQNGLGWPEQEILGTGGTKETALVMLAGILAWSAFAETLSRGTNCLIENANLIKKVVFPSEILPPYLTISSMINMLIGMPVVLLGVLFFSDIGVGQPVLAVPLLLFLQGCFTIGLTLMLCTANALVRDVYHIIGVAVTVWMFATPIFYPAKMVRQGAVWVGETIIPLGLILDFNPMHWMIDSWQRVLVFNTWPRWELLGYFALTTLLVLVVGGAVFRDRRTEFPDLL